MDTYYGCRLITYQKNAAVHLTEGLHRRWGRRGRNKSRHFNNSRKGGMGKRDREIDRKDEPCICAVNLNRWRQTRGGEWRSNLAVQTEREGIWLVLCYFSCVCVYKLAQQARKSGRSLARGGYKLPVIDARRWGGRQLKTHGAHRWPSFLFPLFPPEQETHTPPDLPNASIPHN